MQALSGCSFWQSRAMRLLVIFGPPAVGKLTVGRETAERILMWLDEPAGWRSDRAR